jgi:hypothetical protein
VDAYLAHFRVGLLLDDDAYAEADAPIADTQTILILDAGKLDHIATAIVGNESVERGEYALVAYRV